MLGPQVIKCREETKAPSTL